VSPRPPRSVVQVRHGFPARLRRRSPCDVGAIGPALQRDEGGDVSNVVGRRAHQRAIGAPVGRPQRVGPLSRSKSCVVKRECDVGPLAVVSRSGRAVLDGRELRTRGSPSSAGESGHACISWVTTGASSGALPLRLRCIREYSVRAGRDDDGAGGCLLARSPSRPLPRDDALDVGIGGIHVAVLGRHEPSWYLCRLEQA